MKPKILKGWKIVDSKNESLFVQFENGGVYYSPNEWIPPKPFCGPLCVFRTRRTAREHKYNFGGRIFPCLFEPSDSTTIWAFNQVSRSKIRDIALSNLPGGTVLASRVKILK